MQKIMTHLWFDTHASEATQFYMSLFEHSSLVNSTVLKDTPSGDADLITFTLGDQTFQAISAGPYFQFNPSMSLMVSCQSEEEVQRLWQALIEGGQALMPLMEYPFSKLYGWVADRFGLSWQLMLVDDEMPLQKITPSLLFSNEVTGQAEEAAHYYMNVFERAKQRHISYFMPGEVPYDKAKVSYLRYMLDGMEFVVMDNGNKADFHFNESMSFIINCQDQAEIDYFWDKLSHVPESEQCGWVKDKFGVSWQIVPAMIDDFMISGTEEENQRVMQALLQMKKINIAELEDARNA